MRQIQRTVAAHAHVVGRTGAEATHLGSGNSIKITQINGGHGAVTVVVTGVGNVQIGAVHRTEAQITAIVIPDRGGIRIGQLIQRQTGLSNTGNGFGGGRAGQNPMGLLGQTGVCDHIGNTAADILAHRCGSEEIRNRLLIGLGHSHIRLSHAEAAHVVGGEGNLTYFGQYRDRLCLLMIQNQHRTAQIEAVVQRQRYGNFVAIGIALGTDLIILIGGKACRQLAGADQNLIRGDAVTGHLSSHHGIGQDVFVQRYRLGTGQHFGVRTVGRLILIGIGHTLGLQIMNAAGRVSGNGHLIIGDPEHGHV